MHRGYPMEESIKKSFKILVTDSIDPSIGSKSLYMLGILSGLPMNGVTLLKGLFFLSFSKSEITPSISMYIMFS